MFDEQLQDLLVKFALDGAEFGFIFAVSNLEYLVDEGKSAEAKSLLRSAMNELRQMQAQIRLELKDSVEESVYIHRKTPKEVYYGLHFGLS